MENARTLHPLAWWGWGIALAVASSRTVNFWFTLTIALSAITVTFLRKSNDPWASALQIGMKIALVALGVRMLIAIIFSVPSQGHVLFAIPRIQLPHWLAGIYLGGAVTTERLQYVLMESMAILTLIITVAAASSLANPKQTLRTLPGVLHEAGVSLIMTTTLIPHFASSVKRIRQARKLRGDQGTLNFKRTLVPLFEEALERALVLAESMEARGYGYKSNARRNLAHTSLILIGVFTLFLSILQLLLGFAYQVTLIAALALVMSGLYLANTRSLRTRYRPFRWSYPETLLLITSLSVTVLVTSKFSIWILGVITLLCVTPLLVTKKPKVTHDSL